MIPFKQLMAPGHVNNKKKRELKNNLRKDQ
jgi:hypothetical protein